MSSLIIEGGTPLSGRIYPSANKNAVLPILCATLLTDQPIVLSRVPDITDVRRMVDIFMSLGSHVNWNKQQQTLHIHHKDIHMDTEQSRLPQEMRSSIMLVPPLVARFGRASLNEDVKGCTLGVREIDPHVEVFEKFGCRLERSAGMLHLLADGFHPVRHWLDYASVTTTENFVLCAALASGESTLINAASEPHVQEFCRFMQAMGVKIDGVGTSMLTVNGQCSLNSVEFCFGEDHHEIATFLALGAISHGHIEVKNSASEHFPLIDRTFAKFGVQVKHHNGWSSVSGQDELKISKPYTSNILTKVEAAPWPYFPVDLLPIFVALATRSQGSILFWNKVYDGALGWANELTKFGAAVFQCDPHRLIITGGLPLQAAEVESPYIIRVAIALLMVGASIQGRSVIHNAEPIRRAHPNFLTHLQSIGAQVEWPD